MQLKELNVGCFGGGTGLPSLLGGLKRNPWLRLHAVVTMFDSGGSSGVLRDELGVLPPGDVLKCALALARNESEARRVLLSRLPTLEHARLAGHTGGNLLLSMMEQYSGDFLAAVDGLRRLLGCSGHVWPVSTERATLCAAYRDGTAARGEPEVDAGQREGRVIERVWLEPPATIHPAAAEAIAGLDAIIIGPGSFYTSLMPTCLVRGVREAVAEVRGPVIYIANLLTEGGGMRAFTAAPRRPAPDPAADRAARGRHRGQPGAAGIGRARALRRRGQAPDADRRNRRLQRHRQRAASGPASTPATTAAAWPTRCGASSPSGSCTEPPVALTDGRSDPFRRDA